MAVVGLDDTDSRERGMCTTYLAARLAARFREESSGSRSSAPGTSSSPPTAPATAGRRARQRPVLVRLNPAVPHKTRGNAALGLHTALPVDRAFDLARAEVAAAAETADPDTHPGLVVAPGGPYDVPDDVVGFSRSAMRELRTLDDALELIEACGYRSAGWKSGRGRIGALAAVGAWRAVADPDYGLADWTYELIAYREPERWGTPRTVDEASVFAAAESAYPEAWDTVDRVEGEAVCVPNTPGPVLYGVRGDDPGTVRAAASRIESEPVSAAELFLTNQGTDAHVRRGSIGSLEDGRAYRVEGVVADDPETRRGGHVFVPIRPSGDGETDSGTVDGVSTATPTAADPSAAGPPATPTSTDGGGLVECAAFEPTKRFRDRVRALRPGDRVVVCGEVGRGTLKLEKLAVRDLVEVERVTPTCPDCGRRMESAGADQGYRCRPCGTRAAGTAERPIERELAPGWYEVPPVARRHVAKPLVRGGFDGPVHPER